MANPNPSPSTRFQPGRSGNPEGYSRGRRFIDELDALIEDKQARPALVSKWLTMILAGDFRYFKEYLDRRDGRPKDAPNPTEDDAPATDEHGNSVEP